MNNIHPACIKNNNKYNNKYIASSIHPATLYYMKAGSKDNNYYKKKYIKYKNKYLILKNKITL